LLNKSAFESKKQAIDYVVDTLRGTQIIKEKPEPKYTLGDRVWFKTYIEKSIGIFDTNINGGSIIDITWDNNVPVYLISLFKNGNIERSREEYLFLDPIAAINS
jgi:hypothetical protein